jgi:hypothetical protein
VVLGHFDVKIAALLGAAGVASPAVALAAQETVANMISGQRIVNLSYPDPHYALRRTFTDGHKPSSEPPVVVRGCP